MPTAGSKPEKKGVINSPKPYPIDSSTVLINRPLGDNYKYPHQFTNEEGISFASECEGVTLSEYPILLGRRQNPWVPGRRTRIPGGSEVRVIFASISATEAVFCGVIEKSKTEVLEDGRRAYRLCPI